LITFDHLQDLLSDWYEVSPSDLGLPDAEVPEGINPILTDFYRHFGTLARRKSQFGHPESDNTPLSCQDHIFSADELKHKDGYTIFCDENQSVFVVAASDDAADTNTYAEGDAVFQDRTTEMTDIGVPLEECLVTCVLRETIMSVNDRYRRITPEGLNADLAVAQSGQTVRSRYIWPDVYFTFHLSKDIWFMDWDEMKFSARRGLWRHKPSTWQEQIFENGGSWSSGPSKPTVMQKIERMLTGYKSR
jgi:hypothetical protein